jgi:ribonuclease P protein component
LKKRQRLTRQSDFQLLLGRNRLYTGRALIAFGQARADGPTRVGVSASRKLRGSVIRNRARRRLREAARTILLAPDSALGERGIGYDVVLIARPAAVEVSFSNLQTEVRAVLERLTAQPR